MARIEGVSSSQAGPIVRLVYRFGPRPETGRAVGPAVRSASSGCGRFRSRQVRSRLR